jgi:hypothetical protein
MRTALIDLELSKLLVIYPGPHPYPLAENIHVTRLAHLANKPDSLLD